MIKHFIESDMKRPDDKMSRCQFIMRYFLKANGMDKKNLQVTKAKNPEKDLRDGERWQEISATFELEKFPGDLKPLDWIGLQWPGKAGAQATPPSPWEYEFVPLNDDMNNKKADVSLTVRNKRVRIDFSRYGGVAICSQNQYWRKTLTQCLK